MKTTSKLSEKIYQDVRWQDGDLEIVNNKCVLHGRKTIMGNVIDRELFIGMGY
jgi:alpha-ketoglutarate-dependent taurine dioxygenase